MSKLEAAAIRYAEATAEIRRLTAKLGEMDEDGPLLRCTTPVVGPSSQTSAACRKWTYECSDPGEDPWTGGWVSTRDRDNDEWCPGCIAIQEIVDQRRAAKRKRGAALSALSNLGRGLMRKEPAQ